MTLRVLRETRENLPIAPIFNRLASLLTGDAAASRQLGLVISDSKMEGCYVFGIRRKEKEVACGNYLRIYWSIAARKSGSSFRFGDSCKIGIDHLVDGVRCTPRPYSITGESRCCN